MKFEKETFRENAKQVIRRVFLCTKCAPEIWQKYTPGTFLTFFEVSVFGTFFFPFQIVSNRPDFAKILFSPQKQGRRGGLEANFDFSGRCVRYAEAISVLKKSTRSPIFFTSSRNDQKPPVVGPKQPKMGGIPPFFRGHF